MQDVLTIFNAFGEFIKSVGFPIAAFILVWWDNRESRKNNCNKLEALTEAINNLSLEIKGGQ